MSAYCPRYAASTPRATLASLPPPRESFYGYSAPALAPISRLPPPMLPPPTLPPPAAALPGVPEVRPYQQPRLVPPAQARRSIAPLAYVNLDEAVSVDDDVELELDIDVEVDWEPPSRPVSRPVSGVVVRRDLAALRYVVLPGAVSGELVLRALAADEPPPFGVPIAALSPTCASDARQMECMLWGL